ncbi:hypothetical protein Pcinc_002915 [Petrolisthes cinctipes]|uniref:Sulfotransferase n=1 Tax=Petrolisthes cinctipes TaxID=88211 RepID=A0AAE1L1S3_PETCI|nr:hypothetical protein Pcinc_002915 [Petrolisthes cinctipes]
MKATFLKRLLHLKSLIRFLLLLMLGATTTVMLLSGYERFNLAAIRLDNTWVAENWRLINLNIGKREGYDGTQLEKKPSGGDVNLATPIIVEPNSLDNIYRKEDSGYDGKNQRGPAREEAGTGRHGNTQNDQITTKKTSHSEESLVTVKQEERNEPTTHHVLLVSSMGRSGSSFLGQILSSVPSAFYYFEPLYMMRNHLQEDMVWQGLMGLFTCNMSRKFLYAAVNRKNVLNSNKNLAHCSARCLKSGGLVKECRSKKVKAIKSIRTHVAWVAPLLNALPSLKVIHLVRDPRGTVRSMASLGWLQRYNLTTGCNKFSQDLLNGKTLTALYPDSLEEGVALWSFSTVCQSNEWYAWAEPRLSDVTVYVVITCHFSTSPLMKCTAPLHLTTHALHPSTSPLMHCTAASLHLTTHAMHPSTSPLMHCTAPLHLTTHEMHCTPPPHHSCTVPLHLTTHALHCTPPPHHSCTALYPSTSPLMHCTPPPHHSCTALHPST